MWSPKVQVSRPLQLCTQRSSVPPLQVQEKHALDLPAWHAGMLKCLEMSVAIP